MSVPLFDALRQASIQSFRFYTPSAPTESAPAPAPAPEPQAPAAPPASRRTVTQLFKMPAEELLKLRDDVTKATLDATPPADAVQQLKERCSTCSRAETHTCEIHASVASVPRWATQFACPQPGTGPDP